MGFAYRYNKMKLPYPSEVFSSGNKKLINKYTTFPGHFPD